MMMHLGHPPKSQNKVSSPSATSSSAPAAATANSVVSPRPGRTVDHEVSYRISKRLSASAKTVDAHRKSVHTPLEKQVKVKPEDRDVARTVKHELDLLRNSVHPGGSVGWGALLTSDPFQKRLEFLNHHARSGQFIEQYGTQGRYEGEFLYGMRHGKGTHDFRDEVYEGEWKWDFRHGWGTMTTKDGSKIKGEWQNGKPHGYTCMHDANGALMYEGEYKCGKRDGLGRQLFQNGDMYDGGWKEGRLSDRGVYYFANGDKLYGMWKDGQYDGVGVFHYADGSISRRMYKEGLLMSVQDYEHSTKRFGKTLTREGMLKHTRDKSFPKDIFLLNTM